MTEDTVQRPNRRRGDSQEPEAPRARKSFLSRKTDEKLQKDGVPSVDEVGQEPEPANSEKDENRGGTWGSTGYCAGDSEAHRDVRYSIPSFGSQTLTVFKVQMKLYYKSSSAIAMMVMAIMIPVIVTIVPDEYLATLVSQCSDANAYLGSMLALLPLLMGLFVSILCGPPISQEFKDRTAYMNMSLPMSRSSFYLGKYLAGFVLCIGVFMLAYAMALLATGLEYSSVSSGLVLRSIAASVVALFAFSCTAFCLSAVNRTPSTMIPFLLMTILLPFVFLLVGVRYDIDELFMLPVFLPDLALLVMGSPFMGSVNGFFAMMGVNFVDVGEYDAMLVIGIVWGTVFLLLGLLKTIRREM